MGILIFLICLIIFIIPFTLRKKEFILLYIWVTIGFLMFMWGEDSYYQFTHPLNENFGRAIIMGMVFILSIVIILSILILIVWKNLFLTIFEGFIVPLIFISIILYIFFQGYLLFSAYNAYDTAKKMQATDIDTQDIYDFYSPTIKHIQIQVGNPERHYRWSYRRSRYVFEINQYDTVEKNATSKNLSFWHMPYGQYTKDYHFSIPKTYIKNDKYNTLSQITIPSNIPLSKYFNFSNNSINIRFIKSTTISRSINKKLENQYGLQKGIGNGYYYDDDRKKYGNKYLTYSNGTISIQCHYLENNITSDTCHVKMLANHFLYKFDIHKQYIPQWQKIYTGLSKQFESFIVGVKQYPETFNPYKD